MSYALVFDLYSLNLILDILSILGLYLFLFLSLSLWKTNLPNWALRKFDHITFLAYFGILRYLHNNFYDIIIVFVGSVIVFVILSLLPQVRLISRLLDKDTRVDGTTKELFFNVLITAATLVYLFFLSMNAPWSFISAVFSLGFGDGLGEIVGRIFGTVEYSVKTVKTLEGSTAVFIGVTGSIFLSLTLYSIPVLEYVITILAIAFVGCLIEAICSDFYDNLFIPLWVGVVVFLVFSTY